MQRKELTKTAPRMGSHGALRYGLLVKEDPAEMPAEILGRGYWEASLWGGLAGYLVLGPNNCTSENLRGGNHCP